MKALRRFWNGLRFSAKALRAKELPDEEVGAGVLAYLAEHGRTRTFDLYRGFRTQPSKDYVSLAKLFYVLEQLEEQREVYGQDEMFNGRVQRFWNINSFGGKRQKSSESAVEPYGVAVTG